MSDTPREDEGWQEPDDIADWFDDGDDGGALVPRKPRPSAGAPAMALAVPVG
jgi:hypothetical protein